MSTTASTTSARDAALSPADRLIAHDALAATLNKPTTLGRALEVCPPQWTDGPNMTPEAQAVEWGVFYGMVWALCRMQGSTWRQDSEQVSERALRIASAYGSMIPDLDVGA